MLLHVISLVCIESILVEPRLIERTWWLRGWSIPLIPPHVHGPPSMVSLAWFCPVAEYVVAPSDNEVCWLWVPVEEVLCPYSAHCLPPSHSQLGCPNIRQKSVKNRTENITDTVDGHFQNDFQVLAFLSLFHLCRELVGISLIQENFTN